MLDDKMATTRCPNCGKDNPPGAMFCSNCAMRLPPDYPQPMYPAPAPAQQPVYQQYQPPPPVQQPQPMYQQQYQPPGQYQQPAPAQQPPMQYQQQPAYAQAQPQPMMQQPGKPPKNRTMMIIAVIAVIAIVVIAAVVLMVLSSHGPMTIQVTSWTSNFSDSITVSYASAVTFTVNLHNTGSASSTGTITCKVTWQIPLFSGSVQNTQSVTLAAGASTSVGVSVPISVVQYGYAISYETLYSTDPTSCTIA